MMLDDHELILKGVAHLLQSVASFNVVGQFRKSRDLICALLLQPVDLVIMDFSLSPEDMDGLNLIRLLKRRNPHLKVLVLSANDQAVTIKLAIRAGADGFCTKTTQAEELCRAVTRVMVGKTHLPSDVDGLESETYLVGTTAGSTLSQDAQLVETLTEREREVLLYFLDGMSVIQIAGKVARSRKTVSGHKRSAYQKLGIRSDNELFKKRLLIK